MIAIDNKDEHAINNLGIVYYDQEKDFEAEKYYMVAIYNKDVHAMHNLGTLYWRQGRLEHAEKYYLMAIENKSIDSLYSLASVYYAQERYEEEEKCYLMGIENNNCTCLLKMIETYDEAERYDDLLQLYEKYHTEMQMNIDSIIIKIFDLKIQINNNSKCILKTFEFANDNFMSYEDQQQLEIFKFTMEIPMLHIYDSNEYDTFRIIKHYIMPCRKYIRVPKFIIIEITKWLFK